MLKNRSIKSIELISAMILALLIVSCNASKENKAPVEREEYQANWSSLRKHNTPEWLDGMTFVSGRTNEC